MEETREKRKRKQNRNNDFARELYQWECEPHSINK